jgi:hypothetical protein
METKKVTFTYAISPKSIGGFEIDAFVSEKYSFANKVSTQKVEGGGSLSHITEDPDTLTIEGFISGAKFETYDGEIPDDITTLEVYDPKTRIRQAYQELLRMKRERQPVAVVTGLDTFPNMLIMNFSIDRSAENGADMPFSMTFQDANMLKSGDTAGAGGDQAAGTASAGLTGKESAPKEDFVERTAYNNWIRTRGSYPTRDEFMTMFGESPEQFAEKFGG